MPTGQVTGVRRDADLLLDLVEQLERVAAGPVPLVDEGEQRQAAGPAHLEQLERLRLDALGRVEHHDRGVGGGQHPVGVLGEVAVARGVEQVERRESRYGNCSTVEVIEMPRCCSISIQSEVAAPALATGLHRAGADWSGRRRRAGTSR